MPTLSNGTELTYVADPVQSDLDGDAFVFYLTPPGASPAEFAAIENQYSEKFTLEKIDIFDGYFAITVFDSEERRNTFLNLDTYIYRNDGHFVRRLHDTAAWASGSFDFVDFKGPDDVTVTWTRANNYSSGHNTQYGRHQVGVAGNVPLPDIFVNHAPLVTDMYFSVAAGQQVAEQRKFNGIDADYDLLSYAVVDGPDHGSLELDTAFDPGFYPFEIAGYGPFYHADFLRNNLFQYAPEPGFVGTDTFTVRATDGQAASRVATITVTVAPAPPKYYYLTSAADMVSYSASDHPVMVAGRTGNDALTGSQFNDSINGGPGNDLLYGASGKDTLTGGRDADRMRGDSGNDTFAFHAGDIANPATAGAYDEILDFHGAGQAGGAMEQDFVRITGFGAGTTVTFHSYASADHRTQLYAIDDPTSTANDGLIRIHMADGTNQLAAGDFGFF